MIAPDAADRKGVHGCTGGPAECGLRIGTFGAEPWSESMRGEIEHATRRSQSLPVTAAVGVSA